MGAPRGLLSLLLGGLILASLPGLATAQGGSAQRDGAAASGGDEAASYEFLVRQGTLLFEYGQFEQSARSFQQACPRPEGERDFDCWRKLALSSEKAALIGVAIRAWAHAAVMEGESGSVGATELLRLQSAYGKVVWVLPSESALPSTPGELKLNGFLIDPIPKAYLRRVQAALRTDGVTEAELWLPPGEYEFEQIPFTVKPGIPWEARLPMSLVPYRPAAAAGAVARTERRALSGPWELGLDVGAAVGGSPGGEVGLAPAAPALRLRAARHLGPVRLEAALRAVVAPVGTNHDVDMGLEDDRSGATFQALGSLDLGVNLALGPAAYLVPHVGLLGGSLGRLVTPCTAEQSAPAVSWEGECGLPAAGLGGQLGLDLWLLPGAQQGRLALRIGLQGEGMLGVFAASAEGELGGDNPAALRQVAQPRFPLVRAVVDVGASVRF